MDLQLFFIDGCAKFVLQIINNNNNNTKIIIIIINSTIKLPIPRKIKLTITTAYSLYDGHSTSINTCGVSISNYEIWGVRAGVQVFRREFHTHIHLD